MNVTEVAAVSGSLIGWLRVHLGTEPPRRPRLLGDEQQRQTLPRPEKDADTMPCENGAWRPHGEGRREASRTWKWLRQTATERRVSQGQRQETCPASGHLGREQGCRQDVGMTPSRRWWRPSGGPSEPRLES